MKPHSIYQYLLYVLAFSLSFGESVSRFILPLLFISILFIVSKQTSNIEITRQNILRTIPLFLFILLIFTRDIIDGNYNWQYLERLLAIPLLGMTFFLSSAYNIELSRNKIFLFFVFGIGASFFINFFIAMIDSTSLINGGLEFNPIISNTSTDFLASSIYGGNKFMGPHFSKFMHPTYISLLINSGIFLTVIIIDVNKKLKIVILLILITYIFLVSSKAGLFSLPITFMLILWLRTTSIKKSQIVWSLFVLISLIFVIKSNPRITTMIQRAYSQGLTLNKDAKYSYGSRILVWSSSLEVISNNLFFGTGPFSSQDVLNATYQKFGYLNPYKNNYNAHNQFLQITISFGITGLIVFIYMLFAPLGFNLLNNNIYLAFLVIFVFNALFESLFGRYEGIVIFAFFYSYLVIYSNKHFKTFSEHL